MTAAKRSIAALQLLLVAPGALFMLSLFLRDVQPALQTGRVVAWFSHHLVLGLYASLAFMPLAALVIGGTMAVGSWRSDAQLRLAASGILSAARNHCAVLLVVAATLTAAVILLLVALHLLTG